jgi:phospholipid/cholesterol/gamma-HCH transport system substrate-binding protein
MKTSKNTKALIVAIFTLIGIVIFVTGVWTLGGQHKLFSSNAAIKASFANVNGLQPGNNVWFEGVNVGSVKSISFLDNCRVEVVMMIEKKNCKFIPGDARAKIALDGLIGNRIVLIEGGSEQSPSIKNGDTIESEKALTGEDLMNTLQRNNINLLEITGDLKKVSSGLANGEGTFGTLLTNRSLFDELKSMATTLNQASTNAKQLTGNLAGYSSQLQKNGSLSNDLVTDTIIFSRLRNIVNQIDDAASDIKEVANNLQRASESINDSSKPVGAFMNDRQITDTVKILLGNLNEASKKLNEDLEAAQHNFLLHHYFKNKEKEQSKSQGQKNSQTDH